MIHLEKNNDINSINKRNDFNLNKINDSSPKLAIPSNSTTNLLLSNNKMAVFSCYSLLSFLITENQIQRQHIGSDEKTDRQNERDREN